MSLKISNKYIERWQVAIDGSLVQLNQFLVIEVSQGFVYRQTGIQFKSDQYNE